MEVRAHDTAHPVLGTERDVLAASRSLKAISHPLRLKILCMLTAGESNVQDIVERMKSTQSNISQHLAILRDKGILDTRKNGNKVWYRIGDPRVLKLMGALKDAFCRTSGH